MGTYAVFTNAKTECIINTLYNKSYHDIEKWLSQQHLYVCTRGIVADAVGQYAYEFTVCGNIIYAIGFEKTMHIPGEVVLPRTLDRKADIALDDIRRYLVMLTDHFI